MTTRTLPKLIVFVIVVFLSALAHAQFTPGLLTNESYWSDGKAEFDIYDGQLMRGGELRHCEVLHIFLREQIDPKTLARADDTKRNDAINAIHMQQIWNAPIGLFVEQASLTALWRLDSVSLAQLHFIGTESFGNIERKLEEKRDGENSTWTFTGAHARNHDTGPVSTISISPEPGAIFVDELPLRVRTIDFTTSPAEFEISLAPSITGKDEIRSFVPAKVSWKRAEKNVEVIVKEGAHTNHFLLDRDFPFLLREWTMPDGSKLTLKRGLKADYWNYGRNGDRERALKNPMLQHPD